MPVHTVPQETFGGVVSQDAPPAARSTRVTRIYPSSAPPPACRDPGRLFWSTSRRFSVLGVPVGARVPGVERSEPPESRECRRPSPDRQPPSAFCSAKCPLSIFGPSLRKSAPSSVAASRHDNRGVSALRASSSPVHLVGHHDPLSILPPGPTRIRPQEPATRRTGEAGQNDRGLKIGRKPTSALPHQHGAGTGTARTQDGSATHNDVPRFARQLHEGL